MKVDLIDRFINFSKANSLFGNDDQIIVALSGGGDSVALVDLFSRLNQPIILAHCNFKLRDLESDEDEEFVRKISVVYDLPLHITEFRTREYSVNNGISIEMAARELRYEWFEKIRIETGKNNSASNLSSGKTDTFLIDLIVK